MAGIHLESVSILADVYTHLGRYRTELTEELKNAQVAAQRALKALDYYERAARKVLAGLEEAMNAIRRQAEPNRDATYSLQRQIDDAQDRLRRCQSHRSKIESAMQEFDRQRYALSNHLEKDLPQSQSLLIRLREHVEHYSS